MRSRNAVSGPGSDRRTCFVYDKEKNLLIGRTGRNTRLA